MDRLKIIVTALFLSFFCLPIFSEGVELLNLVDEVGGELQWEPGRKIGLILRGNDILTFKPGFPWMIMNYSRKIAAENISESPGGIIIFSENDAVAVRELFKRREYTSDELFVSTIILDPGHGGRDPGAVGRHDIEGELLTLLEKEVVLKVSRLLAEKLRIQYPDRKIVMTRPDDTYVSLEERSDTANDFLTRKNNEVIIFISIHANASLNSKASGFEVWHLPPDYSRDLSGQIDTGLIVEGAEDEVLPILSKMLEEELSMESVILAKKILDQLDSSIGDVSSNRGLREESWAVVRNSMMSSVLVEIGFITNRAEALLLNDYGHLKKIAEGLYNGIGSFVSYIEGNNTE